MGNEVMRRHCVIDMDRKLINEENTFLWLRRGNLKAKADSEIIAAKSGFTEGMRVHAPKYLNIGT
jgi:hypothetical protein